MLEPVIPKPYLKEKKLKIDPEEGSVGGPKVPKSTTSNNYKLVDFEKRVFERKLSKRQLKEIS